MRRAWLSLLLLGSVWLGLAAVASAAPAQEDCGVTMSSFMKDKIKPTMMDRSLAPAERERRLRVYFTALASMSPDPSWDEGPGGWKQIAAEANEKGSWSRSCKSCHERFQEPYQKAHATRELCAPKE